MKTTDDLTSVLLRTHPDALSETLEHLAPRMAEEEKPFAAHMRAVIRENGLRQQAVFLAADIPEGFGYKLVSEERHTHRRDTILRLCFAARMTVEQAQRALRLQGLSPLYSRLPRDAALLVALNAGMYEILDVNDYLQRGGFEPLAPCGSAE